MIRGTFANIRLRNQLAPRHRGRLHPRLRRSTATVTTVFEASEKYIEAGTPLVVLSGKEYGSGSSRDWAAKGTALLGVKAVIAESYERIHRSNLIGMGVLPLQYPEGQNAESLGLTGEETFSISGVTELNDGGTPKTVKVKAGATSSSTPWSASTPRARRTTTATAASCSTSCAACSTPDRHHRGSTGSSSAIVRVEMMGVPSSQRNASAPPTPARTRVGPMPISSPLTPPTTAPRGRTP